jgi:hypothetical protein
MTRARVEEVIGQGMHRFLGDGVHYRDLLDIRAEMDDWSQWCATWSRCRCWCAGRNSWW